MRTNSNSVMTRRPQGQPTALWVAHWPLSGNEATVQRNPSAGDACARPLLLGTCLRELWISPDTLPVELPGQPDVWSGNDAYRFLLEVITGLQSRIPGETNISGQFRHAWQEYRKTASALDVQRLAPIVHRLMNDAAEIRASYLQGIGGASYGSLVRKLLAPSRGERVLFVGAGEFTRSILPYFKAWDTAIWNRRPSGLRAATELRWFDPEQAAAAADWAQHVILTTPLDSDNDGLWQSCLQATEIRSVVHLGHRRGTRFAVSTASNCYDLDHVFELRATQAGVRSLQITRARAECRRRASGRNIDESDLAEAALASA